MKLWTLFIVFFAGITFSAVSVTAVETPSPVVKLDPFIVRPSWVYINVKHSRDGKITDMVIESVTKKSPAYKLGMRDGMEIVEINGIKVAGLTTDELVIEYAKRFDTTGTTFKVKGTWFGGFPLKTIKFPPEALGKPQAPQTVAATN